MSASLPPIDQLTDMTDKVVFISAGAAGIGRVIAETFMNQGAKVFVCDIIPEVVDQFLTDFPSAGACVANVAKFNEVEACFKQLEEKFGKLDVLVNCAGIAGPTASVEDTNPDEWDACIDIDINGQFYCTKLAVPLIKKQGGGSIVNISSNAAFSGFPLRGAYTASKWALIGLTKTWAMELGTDNIRVNALCPGSVKGPRIDGVIERDAAERGMTPQEIKDVYLRQSSLRVFVGPEDVANMALFLSSKMGATISGQAIGIDGHTEGLTNWLD